MANVLFVVFFSLLAGCGSVAAQAVPTVQSTVAAVSTYPPPAGGIYVGQGEQFSVKFGNMTFTSLYWTEGSPAIQGNANLLTAPCGSYHGVFVLGLFGDLAECTEAIVRVYVQGDGTFYIVSNTTSSAEVRKSSG